MSQTAPYEYSCHNEAAGKQSQDQFAIRQSDTQLIVFFADGAGGTGDGFQAATQFCVEIDAWTGQLVTSDSCRQALLQSDMRINAGECTGIVIVFTSTQIYGASVGDSLVWQIVDHRLRDLSLDQQRKPRLGTQQSRPTTFQTRITDGTFIIASDGLGNYANQDRMIASAAHLDFSIAGKTFTDAVRLPSGRLHDDVGIVVVRKRRRQQRVSHYVINA